MLELVEVKGGVIFLHEDVTQNGDVVLVAQVGDAKEAASRMVLKLDDVIFGMQRVLLIAHFDLERVATAHALGLDHGVVTMLEIDVPIGVTDEERVVVTEAEIGGDVADELVEMGLGNHDCGCAGVEDEGCAVLMLAGVESGVDGPPE